MTDHLESAKLHRAVAMEILSDRKLETRTRAEALTIAQIHATLAVADATAALAEGPRSQAPVFARDALTDTVWEKATFVGQKVTGQEGGKLS